MTGQMGPTLSLTALSPPGSEQTLVDAARAGSDQAFSELYARYQDRIRAFILAKVHDHGRAEDIAQEVFISALRRLRSSEQAIAFKPWIYEIAKNACIDEFRRNRRTSEVSLDADEELASGRRGLMAIAPTPPAAVESKLQLDDLQGAFGGLSENHHRLLVMREFEGRSYTEIAASTGMSLAMVESALFRARRKLSEEYDELASGRRCEQVQVAIESGRMRALRSIGIRERRQLTRHLAHCQPCRREARLAGVDEALVKPRSIAARIAALLPFPLWRWPWHGGSGGPGGAGAGSRGTGGSTPGQSLIARTGGHHLSAAQSLQSVAGAAGPTGSSVTLGQAAAAVAAIAIAGAGGGAATGLFGSKHAVRPAAVHRLAAYSSSGAAATPHRSVIGVASTAVARASHHSAGAGSHRAGGFTRQATRVSHGTRHRATGTKAARSVTPGTRTPGSTSGTTAGTTKAPGTTGTSRTTRTRDSTKPAATPVTKVTAPVSRAPARVVSTVTGVTHRTVSTVGRVVQGVGSVVHGVGSVVQGAGSVVQGAGSVVQGAGSVVRGTVGSVLPPAVSQTLSGVLPPSGSGTTSAGTPSSGSPAAPSSSTIVRPVDATARKVVGTVAGTVSGILP